MSKLTFTSLSVATLLAVGSLLFAGDKQSSKPSQVERGRYLVEAIGCSDCHTPWHIGPNGPEPDASRGLSGHPESLVMPEVPRLPEGPWALTASATNTAWAGPWGVSFTANLTPDDATGIGTWTADNFVAAMRSGKHLGVGRTILPPMPWPAYGKLTDDDLRAVFAYLVSRPAISNRVPEPLAPRS